MRYEWGRDRQLLRDGEQVGSTDKSRWRERASVTIDAGTWSFRAKGWNRVLVTGPDGVERVAATRSGWFREVWTAAGEATYDVKPAHAFTNRLVVRRDGEEVGTLTSARWWTERPALELSADVPLPDAVLLLWVAYVIRQRTAAAAGGASGGAAGG